MSSGSSRAASWDTGLAVAAFFVAVIVVVAAVSFAPQLLPGRVASSPLSRTTVSSRITVGSWNSTNANVSVLCPACGENVTGGSSLNLTLSVRPHCARFGCTSVVDGITVNLAFLLQAVVPVLPANLSANGENFTVTVRAPDTGGPLYLNGTIDAPSPPGPVVIAYQNWTAQNLTNGTGGLRVAPVLTNSEVPGGTWFNETLIVNNSVEQFEDISNVTVDPPFTLVSLLGTLPLELNINQSARLNLRVLAPKTPGSYALNGTVHDRPHPLTVISSFNLTFNGAPVNLTVASLAGLPRAGLGGADLNCSILFGNPTNASHSLAYNRTTGPWFFVNGTPNGSFVIAPNSTFRYFFCLYVEEPAGSYPLGLVFTILYDPDRGRHQRRGPVTPHRGR